MLKEFLGLSAIDTPEMGWVVALSALFAFAFNSLVVLGLGGTFALFFTFLVFSGILAAVIR